jgi:TPR repeat protein
LYKKYMSSAGRYWINAVSTFALVALFMLLWFAAGGELPNQAREKVVLKWPAKSPAEQEQAVSRYRMAAERGDGRALYNLGACYRDGAGVAKDESQAYAYFTVAMASESKNGFAPGLAQGALTILERRMSESQITTGQRRAKELQKEIETKIAAKTDGK